MSKGTNISGFVRYACYPKIDDLTKSALQRCSQCAYEMQMPWDPFNVKLIIVPNE